MSYHLYSVVVDSVPLCFLFLVLSELTCLLWAMSKKCSFE